MKPRVKTALLTVFALALLLLAVVACSDNPAPDTARTEGPPPAAPTQPSAPVAVAPAPAPVVSEDPGGVVAAANPDIPASSGADSGASVPSFGPNSGSSMPSLGADLAVSSSQSSPPDNVVYGSVAWPPFIELPPGAQLIVEMHDVSLQDAPSQLIASQVILEPGEGPVDFYLEFDPQDILPDNTYAVMALIADSDDNLIFINDVAYDVLTQGRPNYVDVELVSVYPIPTPSPGSSGDDPTDGQTGGGNTGMPGEIPALITGVRMESMDEGYLFTATYLRPPESGCGELSSYGHEAAGEHIRLDINLMSAEGCGEPSVAEELEFPIQFPFDPGSSYWVIANGEQTNRFSLPEAGYPPYTTIPSNIASVQWNVMESFPPQYSLLVVTEMPQGSGCSRFNGYDITRVDRYRFEIAMTHHVVDFEKAGNAIACTADVAIEETAIHLGSDFEPGQEYTVVVNTETVTIQAQ